MDPSEEPRPPGAPKPPPDRPGVLPPPLIYVAAFGLGLAMHRVVGNDAIRDSTRRVTDPLGIALFAIGLALDIYSFLLFRRAGTSPNPFNPTTAIVATGPYRYTRNPMYLGMALIYLGVSLFLGFTWPLIYLPIAIILVDRYAIRREERYLERKFGDDYRRYKDTARRWI